ncbi:MAG: LptF/LptG family permease [Phycisphaerales bacterium]|nr:LptF/LptG family permease [Phycisphaerales bacterium]
MLLIDRYIAWRFIVNFAILFTLLFVFAISIDLILQLDRFMDVAREQAGADAGFLALSREWLGIVLNFHGPRIFQFYAYLHGLVAIGAMGFTLAQMHRDREFVAMLAAGISLPRLAIPVVAVVFGLNLLQMINSELIMPRVAPLLMRKHGEIGKKTIDAFEVQLVPDGADALFQAPSFDLTTRTLVGPTILDRDDVGRTVGRVSATSGTWDPAAGAWILHDAVITRPGVDDEGGFATIREERETYAYPTDLSPDVLTMKQYRQYASMLSLAQIEHMMKTPDIVDAPALARFKYARIASVLVNLVVLVVALPFFMLRAPANMLRQSLLAAATTLPMMLVSVVVITVPLADIPPAVSVFIPVVILFPLAAWRITSMPT